MVISDLCLNAKGFPGNSDRKESAHNVGDQGLIPGSGRSPGEGNGNPLQYSCLENPMDRGAWQATVHGVSRVGHNWVTELNWSMIRTLGWLYVAAKSSSTITENQQKALKLKNKETVLYIMLRNNEMQMPELEKEMATHSSILAWRILWTEKPGRLQFMGSQDSDMT